MKNVFIRLTDINLFFWRIVQAGKERFRRILKISLILGFFVYWIFTLIYVMPANYIRIKAEPVNNLFTHYFSQRWTFFAPPPKHNYRLYYIYETEGKNLTIEVTKAITETKRKNAPFNTDDEIVDYVIYGCIDGIQKQLATLQKELGDGNLNKNDTELNKKIETLIMPRLEYQTLTNYAKSVVLKNQIKCDSCIARFLITAISIPKFSDRHKPTPTAEGILFKSREFLIDKGTLKKL